VGGWALIVGGVAFAAFWGVSAASTNGELPWFAGLAVHGVSILALTVGLILLSKSALPGPSGRVLAVGTAIAIVGLLTVFPLFPAGLAVVAFALGRDGWPRSATVTTLVGALALLTLSVWRQVAVGAAIGGEEGAPPLSTTWAVAYVTAILVTAAGLVMLGLIRRRGSR
jgi:hypothetical protein